VHIAGVDYDQYRLPGGRKPRRAGQGQPTTERREKKSGWPARPPISPSGHKAMKNYVDGTKQFST